MFLSWRSPKFNRFGVDGGAHVAPSPVLEADTARWGEAFSRAVTLTPWPSVSSAATMTSPRLFPMSHRLALSPVDRPRQGAAGMPSRRCLATSLVYCRRDNSSHPGIVRWPTSVIVRRVVARLWRKAKMCRRAAAIPTQRGHNADRVLLTLADELEHEADELEGRPTEAAVPM